MTVPLAVLREEAQRLGFDLVGATAATPLTRDLDALEAWLAAGRGEGLAYMARRPLERADPRSLLPRARSVVTVAVPHAADAPARKPGGRLGQVARYAWGRDYHLVVPPRLRALARRLAARTGAPVEARTATDEEPILERALAARAGLGFVGKSTCLIAPRAGSWRLLGEVLLDAEVEATAARPGPSCGACVRCLEACPAGAFPAPFVLDARRCIAFLTIENRGPIPPALRPRLGPWVFGCDMCQEACPWNGRPTAAPWPQFEPSAGVGPRLDLVEVLALDDDAVFRARFRGTPILHAKRAGLARNAAVVARNLGATAAVPRLLRRVDRDREGLVRGHALWALAGLSPERARPLADRLRAADPDPFVRAEAAAVLEGGERGPVASSVPAGAPHGTMPP